MKTILYDKVILGFGHGLIIGHRPESLPMGLIDTTEKSKSKEGFEISKFGLFESASPNFHTYYPNVTASDLKPKESDFVKPVFRLLSEVVVHKNSNPIDFSMNNVLKDSMGKLLGQTLYANHEALVGNELGVVSQVMWQEAYTTASGLFIPAGINGEFSIDAKSHPNIARGVMAEPPSIHSNSVTVSFGWEKSHPKMEIDEFRSKLGTKGSDGQLIRRIVTEIPNYHETSLVAHGADPYAQRVGSNGQINNPEYADSIYSLSAQGKEKPLRYFFSYKDDVASLSASQSIPPNINHIPKTNMKQLITSLATAYNKPEAEITEEFVMGILDKSKTSIAELETATTNLATATADVTRLTAELGTANQLSATLTTENTSLKAEKETLSAENLALKAITDKNLSDLRLEAKRVYTVLKGDNADAAKLALIDAATVEQLTVDLKDYNAELEKSFPATCQDCQSSNVSRNTSQTGNPPAGKTTKTNAEVNAEIRKEAKGSFILQGK